MIENTGLPIFIDVASLALVAIATLVSFFLIVFLVTSDAFPLQLEFHSKLGIGTRYSPLVTSVTLNFLMLVAQ